MLAEICAAGELCDLIADARGSSCIQRWPYILRVYRLVLIVQRLSLVRPAPPVRPALPDFLRAHAAAARTALLFCLPRKLCAWLARRLPVFIRP